MVQSKNNVTLIKKVALNKKNRTSIYIFGFKYFFSLIEKFFFHWSEGFFNWKYFFWLKQHFFWLNNKDTNLPSYFKQAIFKCNLFIYFFGQPKEIAGSYSHSWKSRKSPAFVWVFFVFVKAIAHWVRNFRM